MKINSVLGYAGGSEIDIAVEKGEVLCRGMTIAPHFGREPFDSWHKKGFDQHIVQTAEKRDLRIADVPTLYEIFDKENTADESRRVADVILRGGDFGRPMLVGPGTPPDRVNMLREAYVKSMNNPELIAEAKKARMDMEPVTGEQLQALAKRVMNQPPAVLKRVKRFLNRYIPFAKPLQSFSSSDQEQRSNYESLDPRPLSARRLADQSLGPDALLPRQTNQSRRRFHQRRFLRSLGQAAVPIYAETYAGSAPK